MSGCPFNIPKFSPTSRKVFKCTLCSGPRQRRGSGEPLNLPSLHKAIDFSKNGRAAVPVADELAAIPLSLWGGGERVCEGEHEFAGAVSKGAAEGAQRIVAESLLY
jgi:hypothetical protein